MIRMSSDSAFEQAYLNRYRARHPARPEPCQGLQHYLFHRNANGDYTHPIVREAYAMWQAALALRSAVPAAA